MTVPESLIAQNILEDIKNRKYTPMNDASIQTAINATSIFMQDSAERQAYLNREMAIMDYESDKAVWTEEGRAEGENRLSRLIAHLIEIGQNDQILSVTKSAALRNQLYEKYNIM